MGKNDLGSITPPPINYDTNAKQHIFLKSILQL